MPSILNLKFKGNKSFVAFSNLADTESLTKTWKVCTKVASYLEQGQRLENLSWRLWHLQNLMVDSDNAKSKREFRKLSKCMGDKLDKEKGRNITELEAPDFKRNHSTDIIQQRAAEKERLREASQNAKPGTIKRMQFTFSIDQPPPSLNPLPVKKPDLKPSPEFNKRARRDDRMVVDDHATEPLTQRGRKIPKSGNTSDAQSLRFPSLFSNDFGPAALLYPTPTLTNSINYGEGLNPSTANDGFSIVRPTIELPLDELLDAPDAAPADVTMHVHTATTNNAVSSSSNDSSSNDSDDEASDMDLMSTMTLSSVPPISQVTADKQQSSKIAPVKTPTPPSDTVRASTPTGRPSLTVRTQPLTRSTVSSSAPGATPTSLNPALLNRAANTVTPTANVGNGPGGAKAECSNCGATHTPLWRRGLNDELNCNACGLYCKLHKRPRPKSMRNSHHGEGRSVNPPNRQDNLDVTAQCYNCQTTTTPLWRKDDDGKTVCNACGLYYKLHGSARPISMKSDIIRKRSRHEARRAAAAAAAAASAANSNNTAADTPSVSPGVSRRTSPSPLPFPMPESEAETSPTFAPDSSTAQIDYDFRTNSASDEDMHLAYPTQSELLGALGPNQFGGMYGFQFPGPYAAEHLQQFISNSNDPLPFASVDLHQDSSDSGLMSPRSNKRRRMSNDSTSEPPSSAVSFSSYGDGYSSSTSATSHSQRSSISVDFPFSCYPSLPFFNAPASSSGNPTTPGTAVPVFRGNAGAGSAFWHPPLMLNLPQSGADNHPPEESPMDYLQPPPTSIFTGSNATTTQEDEQLFSTYLHPPCAPEDGKASSPSTGANQEKDENAMEGIASTGNGFDRFWS